jgi:hypothetical protein
MPRGWLLLLCVILLAWWPAGFALELAETLPSIAMRGPLGALELAAHGVVAALSVAAFRTLWTAAPVGPLLAKTALIGSAAASVQSLYWSVLPHQTKPGDELPLAIVAVVHAAVWVAYLGRSRRFR